MVVGKASPERHLSRDEIHDLVSAGLAGVQPEGKRVLLILPDGTRSGPIGFFFRLLYGLLRDQVAALDCLFALGTHQPMGEDAIHRRLGIAGQGDRFGDVRFFNHHWERPETFLELGTIPGGEMEGLSGGRISDPVPVTLNRMIFDYDLLMICGPVFPHEVVGFSGGNKYLFPGISGSQMIDFTHWLGALMTCYEIIGRKHTPVRAVIDRAASLINLPRLCFSLVVRDEGLAGLYIGPPEESWSAAADLSARVHVRYVERPFQRVLSVMPEMYEDLWTAAKGMYKLEPVVADGGELVIYAPHIREISYTHGEIIDRIGYHVRDYFVKQWERFRGFPWGVLAHSTHVRGLGTYENGVERPRIRVTLASAVSEERCQRVNLGYRDPAGIDMGEWTGQESEGVLRVPRAGEVLYRLKDREDGHVPDST
jgi:nickel-dependent lactate racemase